MPAIDASPRPRPGTPERVALAMGAALVVLVVATAAGLVASRNAGVPTWGVRAELAPLDLLVALVFAPLGALVVAGLRHPVGWVLLAIGWGYALTAGAIAWTLLGMAHPGLPGQAWAPPLVLIGWTAGSLLSYLVLPFLLTPGAVTPTGRRLALVGATITAFATVVRGLVQRPGAPDHPVTGGDGALAALALRLDDAFVPIYALLALGSAAWVAHRMVSDPGAERRALGWLLVALIGVGASFFGFELGMSVEGPWPFVGAILLLLAELMLVAAALVLIRRHRSWRLDLAVSRTLVGVLLTGVVVAIYVVAVWFVVTVLRWGVESAGLVAVAGIALLLLPLHALLRRQVERLVFGSGADPALLLTRVSGALAAEGADDNADRLTALAEALRRGLRLGRVMVTVEGRVVASAGGSERSSVGIGVPVPLRHGGRVIGELTAMPRRGERLDPRTLGLLDQISGLVAVAAGRARRGRRHRGIRVL